jgi:hypothetical protein
MRHITRKTLGYGIRDFANPVALALANVGLRPRVIKFKEAVLMWENIRFEKQRDRDSACALDWIVKSKLLDISICK